LGTSLYRNVPKAAWSSASPIMDVDRDNSPPSSEAPDIIEVFEDIEEIGDSSKIDEDQEMAQQEPKTKDQPQQEGQSLEQRLADETRLRKFTEDVLDSRQMELERQEMHNEQLLSQLDELRKELSDVKEQLSEARSEIASKDNQISEVKDQIFRLQPTRRDITESEAVDAYRALCRNVQRWVDNQLKTILDDLDHGRLQTYSPPNQAGRFVSLMREAAKRGLSHDQSDTYHVIAVIMSYLCIVFFSKSFYSPLDDYEGDATCAFIDGLEATMSELPRGEYDFSIYDLSKRSVLTISQTLLNAENGGARP
jgi:DNA repair ATPase RecN